MKKFAGYILYILLRILGWSYRFKYVGKENLLLAQNSNEPKNKLNNHLVACWHEHMVGALLSHLGQTYCLMASLSKDGEWAAIVVKKMGYIAVRGSSSRRGGAARSEMLESVLRGIPAAITVDGPRGPRRVCRAGIVDIAMKSGVPIVPLVLVASREYVFKKSWDQFKLPLPFAKVIVYYDTPIVVPSNLSEEEFNQYLLKVDRQLLDSEKIAQRMLSKM
ncbi:MAG: lysophospholipid acyltransferase family protein [Oligoflexia bacterium]|nr:lysophospholipid acyltransferase family protein [Oligoflexia bacterium]